MAAMRFVPEADQHVGPGVHELLDRVRAILQAEASDALWDCWARETPHGFVVRLQQAPRMAPYTRAAGSQVTYSGGGTLDFLAEDVLAWLKAQAQEAAAAPAAPQRRRSDSAARRPTRSRRR